MRYLLALALFVVNSAAAEFCADLSAKYGAGIIRCVDFAVPLDAAGNSISAQGTATIGTQLFNPVVSATPGATGALHWRMRSYNQVRADNPNLSPGNAYMTALQSNNYRWQRWIGLDRLTPGVTYWYQFKLRFNKAFKTHWGGGGPKIMGMDAGCRTVNGVKKPTICENFTDPSQGFTRMGTATSLEFATITTMNWHPASADTEGAWAYPIFYQGSSNFGGTVGFTPQAFVAGGGTALLEQAGPDVGLVWDDKTQQFKAGTTCDNWTRAMPAPSFGGKPGHVAGNGPCITYGAHDVWHEVTVAFRPSGNFYDTNPGAAVNRTYRHDSLFKAWYDGQLLVSFDPDEAPFRSGQPTKAECAALQGPHPAYDNCRTGIDIYKDSRDVNSNPDYESFDADVTQFILWTFNYRRGYAYPGWCKANIQPTDTPGYGECLGTEGSGETIASHPQFDAFLAHQEVNVYMDDWVAATVPLPMQKRPQGAKVGPGSFGLDARDLDALPPNTWTRLFPGPDKTFYNTGYGKMSPTDPNNPIPGNANVEAHVTAGVNNLTATNYGVEIPVQIGVPLGGGFVGTPYGNRKALYFGGGHSGYRANRVNVWSLDSGRWSQSKYVPDMGSQIVGALGYPTPTPPGTGCHTTPHYPSTTGAYYKTTGSTTAGSKVVKVASVTNMCPIVGLCPGPEIQSGGYAITGNGIPAAAAVYSVNRSALEVTMTLAATATASNVELVGGKSYCSEGGAPNGSIGGRGWWEHMDNRYHFDPRANAWMLVQSSGTWFYDDVTEAWKLASGPHPGTETLLCGGSDYTALATVFAPELNRSLAWCSTGGVFGYDYGAGPPAYTGAKWVQLNQVPPAIQNPQTDVLGQAVWDKTKKRFFYFSAKSTGNYGGTGVANPLLYWFDPFAGKSCATSPYPCGTIGRLDTTKPNHPQSYYVPIDSTSQQPDKTSPCYTSNCQLVTASLTVDAAGSLYVTGRRAGDAQVALWKATDPSGPAEAWTILDQFAFNTYDLKGLRLWNGKPPTETSYEFDIGSSAMGMLNYIPERNAFILITRSGSGNGGASTRGSGHPNEGGCFLNGVADDCFRMYGLALDSTLKPPPVKPPPDKTPTTTTLTGTPNPSAAAASVTFTASVTGNATGNVSFGGVSSCPTAPLAAGKATCTTPLAAGSYTVTASYGGDATYAASSSPTLAQTVTAVVVPPTGDKLPTVSTLITAPNPSQPAQSVTMVARVNGNGATGTFYYSDNGAGIGGCTGVAVDGPAEDRYAQCVVPLPAGVHNLAASYSGDAKYAASSSATLVQNVGSGPVIPPEPIPCTPGPVGTIAFSFSFAPIDAARAGRSLPAGNYSIAPAIVSRICP